MQLFFFILASLATLLPSASARVAPERSPPLRPSLTLSFYPDPDDLQIVVELNSKNGNIINRGLLSKCSASMSVFVSNGKPCQVQTPDPNSPLNFNEVRPVAAFATNDELKLTWIEYYYYLQVVEDVTPFCVSVEFKDVDGGKHCQRVSPKIIWSSFIYPGM